MLHTIVLLNIIQFVRLLNIHDSAVVHAISNWRCSFLIHPPPHHPWVCLSTTGWYYLPLKTNCNVRGEKEKLLLTGSHSQKILLFAQSFFPFVVHPLLPSQPDTRINLHSWLLRIHEWEPFNAHISTGYNLGLDSPGAGWAKLHKYYFANGH